MYTLPKSVTVDNIEYTIRNEGDYRMVLQCFSALQDEDLQDSSERTLLTLMVFYDVFNDIDDLLRLDADIIDELVKFMFTFFNCGQKHDVGVNPPHKLIDWEQDEQLIISAVNNIAGKEVRAEPYLHWWTFMGYYLAIGESPLATVVGIRNKIVTNKKLEKYEREFRQQNPDYFIWDRETLEEKQDNQFVRDLWNKNSKEGS